MRILYLNAVGAIGGAEQVLLTTMAAYQQTDPRAQLHLIAAADGPLAEQAKLLGVAVKVIEMPAVLSVLGDSGLITGGLRHVLRLGAQMARALPAAVGYRQRLRTEIRKVVPDVVHSNGMKTHVLCRLAGLGKIPVVWHLHDFCRSRKIMSRALRWAGRRAAGAIAISQAVADEMHTVLPALRVQVIYNAIDTETYSPGGAAPRLLDSLAGLSDAEAGTLRIGMVATFARWKGQDIFLEAISLLLKRQPDLNARFYIIGGPIYQTSGSQFSIEELRTEAGRSGILDRVGFIGFQSSTVDIYRALDIVVHGSTRPEPFGLTIVEAMSCGRPVIVSSAGGAAELFTDGIDAFGVPPGDASALAAAILRLAADASLRQRLAEHARCSAVSRFDSRRLGPQIKSVYQAAALHQQ